MNPYPLWPVDIAIILLGGMVIGCFVMLVADFAGRWMVRREIRAAERNAVQRLLEQSKHINAR
jgi:hypothetical protein